MRRGGSVLEVLAVAARLGLTSFGGPIAHIGYFRREYVERRGWLDDASFADLVALCQSLPGPASSQLGFAIGMRRAGLAGGIAAWLGFTTPSAVALIAFGMLFAATDLSGAGWIHGLGVAAVAVVAQAVLLMLARLAPDWPRKAIAVGATLVALLWPVPLGQVAIIAGGAVLGVAFLAPPPAHETGLERRPVSDRVGAAALVSFVVLLVGLPLLRGVGVPGIAGFDAFYRSGALVFGGGHVVLPLLHSAVVEPGWVSNQQFLAGYGAAQAVPGPLFTFAGYLGAVSSMAPNGVPGGVLAVIGIFLPGLLLIVGATPFWDRLRQWDSGRRALSGTNAAVVGILAAALYTPVWTTAVRGLADVVIAVTGLAALLTGRVSPIVVVVLAAVIGQIIGFGG